MNHPNAADEPIEDDRCDLDPDKICDNCMLCVTGNADYRAVSITGIRLQEETDALQGSRETPYGD